MHDTNQIADAAAEGARQTDARISEMASAAQKVGEVVKLITAIAEQTNLLALNATIEVARAGEAGRGFAVVASEVKNLATQTAKATEDILPQIAGMQAATKDSVAAIERIRLTIGQMSEITGSVAAAVEEQGTATREIARNVHEASQGTTAVAHDIAKVSRGAEETGAASAQVLASARTLSADSDKLKHEVRLPADDPGGLTAPAPGRPGAGAQRSGQGARSSRPGFTFALFKNANSANQEGAGGKGRRKDVAVAG